MGLSSPTGIGAYRTQILIEERVTGSPQQFGTGEPDDSWQTHIPCWARITPILGREHLAADQVASKVDTRINIRYREGITAAMRVNAGGVYYNIEAVLDVENKHMELLLMCSSGVNEG